MNACRIDARASLIVLAAQLQALHTMIGSIEKRIVVQHRANEASKRLETHPRDRHHWRERHRRYGHGPEGIPVGA